MSDLVDLSALDGLSGNETIKATSNHLRGLIKEELLEETPAFGDASETLLKFHGGLHAAKPAAEHDDALAHKPL